MRDSLYYSHKRHISIDHFFAEFGINLSIEILINLIDSNLYRQKETKPLAFVRYYIVLIISYEPAIIIMPLLCQSQQEAAYTRHS